MNKLLYRLVFSRRLGLRVAVPETARASGKAAGGESRAGTLAVCSAAQTLVVTLLQASLLPLLLTPTFHSTAWAQARPAVTFAGQLPAPAQSLPQPFTSLMRDPAGRSFATPISGSGTVGWQVNGKTATFNQGSVERVLLNWQSFDIAEGYTVRFIQDKDPSKYVTALNRVWSTQPSVIQGSLLADREVILQNNEGVYFGRTARVSAGKFVASTLSVSDAVFSQGIRNITDASPVFTTAGTDHRPTNLNSAISLQAGAEITTAAGGDVLLVAPRVVNQGRIETPKGQTVLAAGDKVYLMSSADPAQRGLIVAVDPIKVTATTDNDASLGIVENAAKGSYKTVGGATVADSTPDSTAGLVARLNEIRAESGTVNLVGLTVRQNGVVNATTAVKGANGAIFLQAMASTAPLLGGAPAGRRGLTVEAGALARVGAQLGTVEIGAGSRTAVLPDAGAATQIDAEVFNPSLVRVEGQAIHVGAGARIEAPAGRIELLAASNSLVSPLFDNDLSVLPAVDDGSRIVVSPQAQISAAGLRDVAVAGARNQGRQRLFRVELADAPVQRDGPLYRSEVFFDLRDGSKITAANVSGAANAVSRTAQERATQGGSVRLEAEGAVLLGERSNLDVSGGSVHYSPATIKNTLLAVDGRSILFRAANAANPVDAVLTTQQSSLNSAYTEGKNGGTLAISSRQLALDGDLRGQVLQGERQRGDGTDPRAAAATLNLGRAVGTLFYLPALQLGGMAAPALDAAVFGNPFGSPLGSLSGPATLSERAWQESGFGALQLRAGQVTQPAGSTVDLGLQGQADIRADRIALGGSLLAPGGSLSLSTLRLGTDGTAVGIGDIRISGASELDTSGLWTNDSAAGTSAVGIQNNGGRVAVSAAGSVFIEPGARIAVSGGARLTSSGSLVKGTAGAISLAAGRSELLATDMRLAGVALEGFDFAAGGSLSIAAPRAVTLGAAAEGLTLAPEFFGAGGFGNVSVNAFGDLRVASGLALRPLLLNWELAPGFRRAASGAMSATVASPRLLDETVGERKPVNLTLAAAGPVIGGGGKAGADLIVERGAGIELEAGGRLTLTATRNLEVGASGGEVGATSRLVAPGGQVTLAIVGPRGANSGNQASEDVAGFVASQALWLGSDAQIDVSGVAKLRPEAGSLFVNPDGSSSAAATRLTGTVYGGGSINLDAQRGYVIAEAGSRLAVDGVAAALNLPGLAEAIVVAMPAGKLRVSSPEGFVLDGGVSARGPSDAGGRALADGGRLELALGLGGVYTATIGTPYPGTLVDNSNAPIPGARAEPRQLVVDDFSRLLVARGATRGGSLDTALDNGIGYVPLSLLRDAGFDDLRLGAGDRIRFDTSLNLAKPLGITLDAPALTGRAGVDVALGAKHIALGNASVVRQGLPADFAAQNDSSPAANTRLRLSADTLDLVGNFGLQGFSAVAMDAGASARGEVRLLPPVATNLSSPDAATWTLNFGGELTVTASQVYASSGTKYALVGLPAATDIDSGSRLVFKAGAGGAAPRPPLSALGELSLSATDIVQGGVLRQPLGSISLQAARRLTLGEASITSVSAEGSTLVYGESVNLSQWLAGSDFATAMPVAKGVSLRAQTLVTAPSALVNASGGGDLQAWEFFPGVGGSSDYLLGSNLYAVLPDYAGQAPLAFNGGRLGAADQARQIVISTGGSGLAPGTYSLLPARYALLGGSLPQGAFLVRRASDQGKAVLEGPITRPDGSVTVAGWLRDAGSVNTGLPGERFIVEPSATFQARSDIRLSSVSQLLADAAALRGAARAPELPRDAGRIQLALGGEQRATWQSQLDLSAQGGRAGRLDVSATQLALLDDVSKTPDGTLGISAQAVGDSGAGSVLLGGVRRLASDPTNAALTWLIDASGTRTLSVDLGASSLQTEELILAASGSVSLAAGTRLSAPASGTLGSSNLSLSGDGGLAVISANAVSTTRSLSTQAAGELSVGANSSLSAPTLSVDASAALRVAPTTAMSTRSLSLGAPRIVIGDSSVDPQATLLSGELLQTVRAVPSLTLRSYISIDFAGTQDWAERGGNSAAAPQRVLQSLVLDAPLLRGLAAADGTPARVDLAAQSVEVRNSSGLSASASAIGQGQLTLQALPPIQYGRTGGLTIGPGQVALDFADARLRSSGDAVLQGSGGLSASRDLTISSARLSATTAAEQSLAAPTGRLQIALEPGSRSLGERVGAGAAVSLTGQTVKQDGRIELPGGRLAIAASGSGAVTVGFGAESSTTVAGFAVRAADGFEAYGQAGEIQVSAAQGAIELLGRIDAGAARRADGTAGTGDAGGISLMATGAGGQLLLSKTLADGSTVRGRLTAGAGSGAGDQGGRLRVDVNAMSSADDLVRAVAEGGVDTEFSLRVRSGDLSLDRDVKARRIAMAADDGRLSIGTAKLDAASSGGGLVQLMAGRELVLAQGAQIDARSERDGANGGDVLLASARGRVSLAAGATIDASGDDDQDGRIVLRAPRGSNTVGIDPLNLAGLRAAEIDIEAVRVYSTVTVGVSTRDISSIATGNSAITGNSGVLGQTSVRNDSASFMLAAPGLLDGLGVPASERGRVHLRAGVEVQARNDLTLAADWALNADRPGGDAGFLTLRAAGNLLINGSVSDGFVNALTTAALNDNPRSWSYRLVAGADLAAANPLAVVDFAAGTAERGNLSLSAGRLVRTGAGSIEMAAGRDIQFAAASGSNAAAMVYVAGRKMAGESALLSGLFARQTAKPLFVEQGGRLELNATRDLVSSEATQLMNNWLWRSGLLSTPASAASLYSVFSQPAWWSEFSRFRQTLGSFGGGGLNLRAGRDIVNLQAMAPTSGWADSVSADRASLQIRNGGDLTVTADRDLSGGQFLLGRGEGRLSAGRDIASATGNLRVQEPMLGQMNGSWRLSARLGVSTTGAFDPTALPASAADGRSTVSGLFYTWDQNAALSIRASAGKAALVGMTSSQIGGYGIGLAGAGGTLDIYARVLPANLEISAMSAGVELYSVFAGGGLLFPAPAGRLNIWSGGDIVVGNSGGANFVMADTSPSAWPDALNPVSQTSGVIVGQNGLVNTALNGQAEGASIHVGDTEPIRIHADGSIRTPGVSTLRLPKQARVSAGDDLLNLRLVGQNLSSGDLTSLTAGRNYLAELAGLLEIGGPGAVVVNAGRALDLGSSSGITTIGNQRNARLPAQGASIKLRAASEGRLDLAALDAAFLRPAIDGGSLLWQSHRDALLALVRDALQLPDLGYDEARQRFISFPAAAQTAFGRQVLAAEFGATYLGGNAPDSAQFTAGLEAAFENRKAAIVQYVQEALDIGSFVVLPGRETLPAREILASLGSAASSGSGNLTSAFSEQQKLQVAQYLAETKALSFSALDLDTTVAARVAQLAKVQSDWRNTVAASLGGTAAGFNVLTEQNPLDPAVQAYKAALVDYSGLRFEAYRDQVLASELASAGATASLFGRKSLPMRLALFDQGFQASELAGAGSFVAQPIWTGAKPLLSYTGSLNMTQSSVITARGGDISLVNPGGAINVGLKDTGSGTSTPKGVIALSGGNIFGYAKNDFQVNTQRVFIVGQGDMNIWSSSGDIDSGRGANTAVAAPPLTARRSVDGVVFEVPATTTGSGLGILEDASGRRAGTIGLYPAFGEILALDAFIRAPSVVLGSTVKGADNLQAASVGGAAATVSAPALAVAPPAANSETRSAGAATADPAAQTRPRNSLLTVELLGLGAGGAAGANAADEACTEQDERDKKCKPMRANCSDAQNAAGQCK